jgi:hypothetical protein
VLSLPGLLGTTLATIPATVPYLEAPAALVEKWRHDLAGSPGLRVGIAWQGNIAHKLDRYRSVPLIMFEPLARIEGVRLMSLQKGPGAEQVAGVADRFPISNVGSGLPDDFAETAGVLKNLDLVITVDTALAHLAGALGVPTWVVLPFVPDWRWQLEREDSPWYPTLRLFRQRQPGAWGEVFERLTAALQTRATPKFS